MQIVANAMSISRTYQDSLTFFFEGNPSLRIRQPKRRARKAPGRISDLRKSTLKRTNERPRSAIPQHTPHTPPQHQTSQWPACLHLHRLGRRPQGVQGQVRLAAARRSRSSAGSRDLANARFPDIPRRAPPGSAPPLTHRPPFLFFQAKSVSKVIKADIYPEFGTYPGGGGPHHPLRLREERRA